MAYNLPTSIKPGDGSHATRHNDANAAINDLDTRATIYGTAPDPNGVITAVFGALYSPTADAYAAAGNGARLWFHRGGGNTNWEVIQGDTGWRRITAFDASGNVTGAAFGSKFGPRSGSSGYIDVRRVGSSIFLRATRFAVTAAPASTDVVVTLPAGFTDSVPAASGVMVPAFDSAGVYKAFGMKTNLTRGDNFSGVAGDFIGPVHMDWSTRDSWPATLPGTAV